jgi:hypothetical protein
MPVKLDRHPCALRGELVEGDNSGMGCAVG